VIQVTSVYPSIFENFQINVAVANRPMTSGGGIYLIGTGTGTVANYKIRNVAFNYVYTSILITRPAWGEISGCYFGDWVQDAIKLWTDQNIEGSGGHVFANYFFGQTSSATQRSCIYLGSGYVNIYDNEMLGALTGIYIAAQNSPVGFIRIWQNTIEEQHDNGIYISSVSNTAVSMVEICNNEFSCVPNGSTYVSSVNIDQNGNPAVNFITDLHVCQNITRHTFLAAGGKHYYISNCKNALISGNILEELGANSPTGIQLTGASSTVGLIAPIVVRDNLFVGTFTAKYALPTNNVVTVHDSTGSTVATLPTNAANGSSFWATDGTPGTYGNAIAGAGTGASVKRVGGAWVNG
jgi:hypothetical protein